MKKSIERYKELVALVNKYNKQYHEDNASDISDYEFDMMNKELKEIEAEHPEWVVPETPTQKVGGKVKREMGMTVTHRVPMLSIQDVFTQEEVVEWVRKVKSVYPEALFSVEHKIDGLSMTLRYQNGKLNLAESRGNGYLLVIHGLSKFIGNVITKYQKCFCGKLDMEVGVGYGC